MKTKERWNHENTDNQTIYSVTVSVHDGKDPFGNANARVVDDTIEVTIEVTDMVVPAIPELARRSTQPQARPPD